MLCTCMYNKSISVNILLKTSVIDKSLSQDSGYLSSFLVSATGLLRGSGK